MTEEEWREARKPKVRIGRRIKPKPGDWGFYDDSFLGRTDYPKVRD